MVPFLVLSLVLFDQSLKQRQWQASHSATFAGLRFDHDEATTVPMRALFRALALAWSGRVTAVLPGLTLKRSTNGQRAGGCVEVSPLQSECFSLAQTER